MSLPSFEIIAPKGISREQGAYLLGYRVTSTKAHIVMAVHDHQPSEIQRRLANPKLKQFSSFLGGELELIGYCSTLEDNQIHEISSSHKLTSPIWITFDNVSKRRRKLSHPEVRHFGCESVYVKAKEHRGEIQFTLYSESEDGRALMGISFESIREAFVEDLHNRSAKYIASKAQQRPKDSPKVFYDQPLNSEFDFNWNIAQHSPELLSEMAKSDTLTLSPMQTIIRQLNCRPILKNVYYSQAEERTQTDNKQNGVEQPIVPIVNRFYEHSLKPGRLLVYFMNFMTVVAYLIAIFWYMISLINMLPIFNQLRICATLRKYSIRQLRLCSAVRNYDFLLKNQNEIGSQSLLFNAYVKQRAILYYFAIDLVFGLVLCNFCTENCGNLPAAARNFIQDYTEYTAYMKPDFAAYLPGILKASPVLTFFLENWLLLCNYARVQFYQHLTDENLLLVIRYFSYFTALGISSSIAMGLEILRIFFLPTMLIYRVTAFILKLTLRQLGYIGKKGKEFMESPKKNDGLEWFDKLFLAIVRVALYWILPTIASYYFYQLTRVFPGVIILSVLEFLHNLWCRFPLFVVSLRIAKPEIFPKFFQLQPVKHLEPQKDLPKYNYK